MAGTTPITMEMVRGCQRSLSLFVLVGVLLLEVGWDGLHDLLSLALVVDGVRVQVLGGAELQLRDASLFILLDCDLIGLGEVVLLPSHHLDELFQVFDLLGLRKNESKETSTPCASFDGGHTYHCNPCSFNKYNLIESSL